MTYHITNCDIYTTLIIKYIVDIHCAFSEINILYLGSWNT